MMTLDQILDVLYEHMPETEREGRTLEQFKAEAKEAAEEDPEMTQIIIDLANDIWKRGYDEGANGGASSSLL